MQAERHITAAHHSTSHSVQQIKVQGKGTMAMTRPTVMLSETALQSAKSNSYIIYIYEFGLVI